MKKILVALITTAVMMANVFAMVPADEKKEQAAQKSQEFVVEKNMVPANEKEGQAAQKLQELVVEKNMVPADEKMGQAVQKLQELVAEAKKAGFSTQETLGLVAQGLEQDALLNIPKLTTQQKEALMYFGLGLISGGVIITGIWALKNHFCGEKKATTTTNKDEAKPAVTDKPAEVMAEKTTAEKPAVVDKPAEKTTETVVEKTTAEKPAPVVTPVAQPVVPPTASTAEKPAVEEKK